MSTHEQTYMERNLALRFPEDAGRLRRLAQRAADEDASIDERALALADIGELLDHHAGHPEMDSRTANFTEAVFVGLAESLCPAIIGDLRRLWMEES